MSQAQITSVEALGKFRADLIVFLTRMQPVLDEVSSELGRTKFWLENEQRQVLEGQARQQGRRLEEAQAELFNARISNLQDSTQLQHMAVQRAQRALQETERKLGGLKRWDRDLENAASPLLKQVDQLQGFLSADMAKAVASLTKTMEVLEAYTSVRPSASPGEPQTETKA